MDTAIDWPRVASHLAAHGHVFSMERPPERIAGGLANLNFRVEVDGVAAVLRRPPSGPLPPGSHDMAREHRILARLPDAVQFVPRSLFYCADPDIAGAPFQIIEYREGLVIRAHLPDALRSRPGVGDTLASTLLNTLAAIHAVDAEAIGLGDLGRPAGFLARAVAGWRKRGVAAAEDGTETLHAELGEWLERHLVPDGPPALLHNDFKLDNMILAPGDLSAVGVVDWDQGTRGDPLFDLATLLSYWAEPADPQAMHDMAQMPSVEAGFPPRADAVATYARLTGRDVSDFLFHRVLAMYKLAVIFLQLGQRHRTGATNDPRYAGLSAVGTGLLAFTHDIAAGRAF